LIPQENILLPFEGARLFTGVGKGGKPYSCIILKFGEFTHRLFDPGYNRLEKQKINAVLWHLADILCVEYTDMSACGSFEEVAEEYEALTKVAEGTQIWLKLTKSVPKAGKTYTCLGEIPCFSWIDDLKYTTNDKLYLVPVTDNDIEEVDLPN
jgi:hypothetical protein